MGPTSNDFTRTRLSHTLEVAQIGRSLALNLGANPDLVETACLCHDLGHPPFGHNGETALAQAADGIGGFEGNAQTLRLMTRLEPKRFHEDGRPAGLNLSRATVDATIKYPWGHDEGKRKFNYYPDDKEAFDWAREGSGSGKSAEAQMMDLADDIAYSVHDVEDAIVSGRVPLESLTTTEVDAIVSATCDWYGGDPDALSRAMGRLAHLFPPSFSGAQRELAGLKDLTSELIGRFISAVVDASPPAIRYTGDVIVPDDIADEILLLKGLAVTYYMLPREVEPQYLHQRTLLLDLVDALSEKPEEMEPQYLDLYRTAENDDARLRVVVDQVAAMTDLSAMAWHARLCGMFRGAL